MATTSRIKRWYLLAIAPAETVVYDLSLQRPFDWEGPWDAAKEEPGRLVTYRHLPNAGQAPSPVVSGGEFVEDEEQGMVLEISEPEDGMWLARNQDTVMHPEGHPDQTIYFWFKAEDTERRQILFAQGHQLIGFNIYLQDGKLYAGSFAPIEGEMFSWFPVPGRNVEGHWLVAEDIKPDQWYHVALVLPTFRSPCLNPSRIRFIDKSMATPKGTRSQRFALNSEDAVHIYSNPQEITLQLRREVPTQVDLAATSFKVSVTLTPADALAVAGELLTGAVARVRGNP